VLRAAIGGNEADEGVGSVDKVNQDDRIISDHIRPNQPNQTKSTKSNQIRPNQTKSTKSKLNPTKKTVQGQSGEKLVPSLTPALPQERGACASATWCSPATNGNAKCTADGSRRIKIKANQGKSRQIKANQGKLRLVKVNQRGTWRTQGCIKLSILSPRDEWERTEERGNQQDAPLSSPSPPSDGGEGGA